MSAADGCDAQASAAGAERADLFAASLLQLGEAAHTALSQLGAGGGHANALAAAGWPRAAAADGALDRLAAAEAEQRKALAEISTLLPSVRRGCAGRRRAVAAQLRGLERALGEVR